MCLCIDAVIACVISVWEATDTCTAVRTTSTSLAEAVAKRAGGSDCTYPTPSPSVSAAVSKLCGNCSKHIVARSRHTHSDTHRYT